MPFDRLAWAQRWRGREERLLARIELENAMETAEGGRYLYKELRRLCGPVAAFSYQGRPLQPDEVSGLNY
jgi:hypothetical protein